MISSRSWSGNAGRSAETRDRDSTSLTTARITAECRSVAAPSMTERVRASTISNGYESVGRPPPSPAIPIATPLVPRKSTVSRMPTSEATASKSRPALDVSGALKAAIEHRLDRPPCRRWQSAHRAANGRSPRRADGKAIRHGSRIALSPPGMPTYRKWAARRKPSVIAHQKLAPPDRSVGAIARAIERHADHRFVSGHVRPCNWPYGHDDAGPRSSLQLRRAPHARGHSSSTHNRDADRARSTCGVTPNNCFVKPDVANKRLVGVPMIEIAHVMTEKRLPLLAQGEDSLELPAHRQDRATGKPGAA